MSISFRNGLYAGLLLALIVGLWLWQLWAPLRQIQLHSEHLLAAMEAKDWEDVGGFLDQAYSDQWGQDRTIVLSRLREVFRYGRNLRLHAQAPVMTTTNDRGAWNARITIEADSNEIADLIKSRVNALDAPFELQWQRKSWKPWDWKLVGASNSALEINGAF